MKICKRKNGTVDKFLQQRTPSRRTSLSDSRRLFCRKKRKKTCEQKRNASYCRCKKKSLLVSATSLNHLISFFKKVQVHFGQNKDTKSWRMMQRYVYMKNNKGSGKSIIFGARKTAEIVWALLTAKTEFDSAKMTGIFNQ